MKRAFPYLAFCIVVIATVMNILYLASIITLLWTRIGVFVTILGTRLERNIYEKQESPLYFKNLKNKPITLVLFILIGLAFTVTSVCTLFR